MNKCREVFSVGGRIPVKWLCHPRVVSSAVDHVLDLVVKVGLILSVIRSRILSYQLVMVHWMVMMTSSHVLNSWLLKSCGTLYYMSGLVLDSLEKIRKWHVTSGVKKLFLCGLWRYVTDRARRWPDPRMCGLSSGSWWLTSTTTRFSRFIPEFLFICWWWELNEYKWNMQIKHYIDMTSMLLWWSCN